jgi:hypothetical protein
VMTHECWKQKSTFQILVQLESKGQIIPVAKHHTMKMCR